MQAVSILGDRFRKLRVNADLTQEQLASLVGCSDRLVRKAESGGPIRSDFLDQIIQVLNKNGQKVSVADLVASHVMLIREVLLEYDEHGRGVLQHIDCFSEEVELFFPGDKRTFSFAGTWRGLPRVQVFLDRFFDSFQRQKCSLDVTLLESANQVTARFKEQVCFHGLWLKPLSISLHFHFEGHQVVRIECQYDTLAAYRTFAAVLESANNRTAI
jgi:transcriptional regulator with XRE-family HTH domain